MTKYTLSIQTSPGIWKLFAVPKEVQTYVKQLEAKIKLGFDQKKFDENAEKILQHIDNSPSSNQEIFAENKSEKALDEPER